MTSPELRIKLSADGSEKIEAELKRLSAAVDKMGSSLTGAAGGLESSFSKINSNVSRTGTGIEQLSNKVALMGHLTAAIQIAPQFLASIQGAGKALFDASASAERLRTQLSFSTGNVAQEFAYLGKLTNKLGLEFASTAQAYSGFAAASRGTAMEGQKTKDVFEAIAKAGAVMGLSTDQASGALLAIQQMMSKGVVSAEEFRGQLGERMPIALQAGAKALGVTTAEFSKLMESGKIVSEDFLPKFAKAITEMLGDAPELAANRLDAAVNRMLNAWNRLKQAGGDSGIAKALAHDMNTLTATADAMAESMVQAGKNGAGGITQLATATGVLLGRSALGGVASAAETLNGSINTLSGGLFKLSTHISLLPDSLKPAAEQLTSVEGKLKSALVEHDALAKRLAAAPKGSSPFYLAAEIDQLALYISGLKKARAELSLLTGKPLAENYGNEGRGAVQKKEFEDASIAAAQKRAKAYAEMFDKLATPAEKASKAIREARENLGEFFTPEVEKRLRESFKKDGPDSSKNDAAQTFAALLKQESDYAKTAVEIIQEKVKQQVISERDGIEQTLAAQQSGYAKQMQLLRSKFDATGDRGEREKIAQQIVALGNDATVAAEKAASALTKLDEEVFKSRQKFMSGLVADEEKRNKQLVETTVRTKEELATIGMSTEALAKYKREKLETAAASELLAAKELDEAATMLETQQILPDVAQKYRELADAKRAAAGQMVEQAGIESSLAAGRAAREASREWEKFADDINRSLTDALYRAFDSGGDFAETFAKTLENTLKASLAKALINVAISTGSNALNAGINALMGTSGANGGTGYNILGLGSNALSAYNLYNGTTLANATSLWNNYAAGTSMGGYTLGSIGAGGSGITAAGGTTGLSLTGGSTGITGSVGGYGSATAGTAGTATSAAGASNAWMSGLTTAAIAYIGFEFGKALGSAMFGGKVSASGSGMMGALGYGGFTDLNTYADMQKSGGWLSSGSSWTNTYGTTPEQRSAVMSASLSLRNPYIGLNRLAGGSDATLNERGANWSHSFRGDINTVLKDASDSLGKVLIPELVKFRLEGEKLADTAVRMASTVAATNVLADVLGKTLPEAFGAAGVAGLEVRQAIVDAAGGLSSFATSLDTYAANYLPVEDQRARAEAAMRQQFSGVGLVMPETKAAFKDLVESLDLTTDAGRKSFVSLMGLSQAFSDWAKDAEAATEQALAAYKKDFYSQSEIMAKSGDDLANAMVKLGVAIPSSKEAFRALVDGINATTEAGHDAQTGLLALAGDFSDWIDGIQSQMDALESERLAIAQNVIGERDGLISGILTGLGKTNALRARELSAVDPLNRQLLAFAYAIEDAQTAAESLSNAQANLAQTQAAYDDVLKTQAVANAQAVISERDNLISGILSSLGKTGELRNQSLLAVDPLNRQLLQLSYAIEDAGSAAQKLTDAQSGLSQAQAAYENSLAQWAAEQKAQMANAGGGIAELVASLRAGTSASGTLSATSGAYHADLAAAGGGDVKASERITASAAAYLEAIKINASSSSEIDIAMTRMANELSALPAVKSWEQQQAENLDALKLAITQSAADLAESQATQTAAQESFFKSLGVVIGTGFSGLDLNVDGLLTFDELKTGLGPLATDDQVKAMIARLDTNSDGQISKLEALNQTTGYVASNTGYLLDDSESQIRELRDLARSTENGTNNAVAAITAGQAAQTLAEATFFSALGNVIGNGFGSFDVDLSGLLTFDELKSGLGPLATDEQIKTMIRRLDINSDGQISRVEALKTVTGKVDDNTADLVDGSDSQIVEMRKLVAETMTTSARMSSLGASIDKLRESVDLDNEDRRRAAQLAGAEKTLEAAAKNQEALVSKVNAGVDAIWALAGKYGMNLVNSAGAPASFAVGSDRTFSSDYYSLVGWGGSPDFAGFKGEFWKSGGVYDQTYGQNTALIDLKAQIETARKAIIDLGGTPKFATGGLHMGGLRLVGENGPELEVTGPSRIFNANETRSILSGNSSGSNELLIELRALRADNRAQAKVIVQLQSRMVKLHERWDATGIPEERISV